MPKPRFLAPLALLCLLAACAGGGYDPAPGSRAPSGPSVSLGGSMTQSFGGGWR